MAVLTTGTARNVRLYDIPLGTLTRLTTEGRNAWGIWTPDGQTLAFVESRPTATTGSDIRILPLTGDRQPRPILRTRFNETHPELSPNGHWLAYTSNESGRDEVYVQPYPGPGPRQQVSIDGGTAPAWSRDGKELFYGNAVPSTGGQVPVYTVMAVPVTPDGRRFLVPEAKDRPPIIATQMILVQNWAEELKRLVPTK